MAVTTTPLGGLDGETRLIVPAAVTATAQVNIADGGVTIQHIQIVNSSTIAYLKFWNTDGRTAVTVGTTAPDMILVCKASATMHYTFVNGLDFFSTGVTVAAVQEAGTAGTTAPAGTITLNMLVS